MRLKAQADWTRQLVGVGKDATLKSEVIELAASYYETSIFLATAIATGFIVVVIAVIVLVVVAIVGLSFGVGVGVSVSVVVMHHV